MLLRRVLQRRLEWAFVGPVLLPEDSSVRDIPIPSFEDFLQESNSVTSQEVRGRDLTGRRKPNFNLAFVQRLAGDSFVKIMAKRLGGAGHFER